MPYREIALTFPLTSSWAEKWGAVRKQKMDGSRYINEYEGAKCFGCGQGNTEKGNKNRTCDRENEWRRGQPFFTVLWGMSKRSEVECVQSLIMAVARKETPIRNRATPIVCTRFCRRSCILAATVAAATPLVYIVSAHCRLAHIFVVATYKSSAFPLTSHYRTWTRDTCARL